MKIEMSKKVGSGIKRSTNEPSFGVNLYDDDEEWRQSSTWHIVSSDLLYWNTVPIYAVVENVKYSTKNYVKYSWNRIHFYLD